MIILEILIVAFYGRSIFQDIIYGTNSEAVRAQEFIALPREYIIIHLVQVWVPLEIRNQFCIIVRCIQNLE